MTKYFPEPNDLTIHELRDLYRLTRFAEWNSFLAAVNRCRSKLSEQIESESLRGEANIVFRHIGARALTGELRDFLKEAEDYLTSLSAPADAKNEKTF